MRSALVVALVLIAGCTRPTPRAAEITPLFEDITARAGIDFVHTNGATGKYRYIEPMPAGCALVDIDGDGFLDIFLVQTGPSEPFAFVKDRPTCRLYRNHGDGTFEDITAGSGLDRDLGYGMGVAAGDYDNDGRPDLLVTAYGGNHLFHNDGDGHFRDVTRAMGLDVRKGYATSAAFGDYDNDGRLDLYICYYAPWDWAMDRRCASPTNERDYCTPEVYGAETHQLLRNTGTRFVDITQRAGIAAARGRGLAVAFVDYDDDGAVDIFVANDITENMLWHNDGNGHFTNVALEAGVARDESGRRMASMGIAIADYDHSGRPSLFVTDFSNTSNKLFHNAGGGLFEDRSALSGVGPVHQNYLSFGCEFLDFDADTWPDLVTANGHVTVHIQSQFASVPYEEPDQLLRNVGDGTFTEILGPALGALATPAVARGLAVGDIDNDGRQDVLICRQNATPLLLRNRDTSARHFVSFRMVGTKSNRDGRHARITIEAGGVRQVGWVRAGSSYCSVSDSRVAFGLGTASRVERVQIRWPSGRRDVLPALDVDQFYTITEGKGVTGREPHGRH